MDVSKNAIVTTTAPDGTIEVEECAPDNYVVVTGPDLEVTNVVVYANGTRVITIKRYDPDR